MSASLAEVSSVVFVEEVTYPFTALIADIGGSTGLFLGLSLFGTLQGIASFARCVLKRFLLARKKEGATLSTDNYYGKLVTEV